MFIETHCHLNAMVDKKEGEPLLSEHFAVLDDVVAQCERAGVATMITVGTSLAECANGIALAKRYAAVYTTVGVHPCDCRLPEDSDLHHVLATLTNWLKNKEQHRIVAIGEVGLDFYHKPYDQQQQIDFFKAQIELALTYNLPVVVHVREAADELLKVMEPYVPNGLRAVIHCFLQQQDFAQQVLAWGMMIGIDAPIGYPKNDWLRAVVQGVPLERMLLETDAPFLPPQQYRGKQNSPLYIPLIAQVLATVKGVDIATIEQVTTANAQRFFSLNA
jgi:TatD DNase family protein